MTKVTGFSEKELAESVTACDEVSIIYETKKTKNKIWGVFPFIFLLQT